MEYSDTNGQYQYVWSTTPDNNGKNDIEIRALDSYGGVSSKTYTISINNLDTVSIMLYLFMGLTIVSFAGMLMLAIKMRKMKK
jgi:hypothetical protein